MKAKSEQDCNQSAEIELNDLSERERMIVQLFKRLDEVSKADIFLFLNFLLKK